MVRMIMCLTFDLVNIPFFCLLEKKLFTFLSFHNYSENQSFISVSFQNLKSAKGLTTNSEDRLGLSIMIQNNTNFFGLTETEKAFCPSKNQSVLPVYICSETEALYQKLKRSSIVMLSRHMLYS